MEKRDNPGKRYKCGRCEYATIKSSDLKKHVLAVHDKVKKFKCELCEYAASKAGTLKNHVMRVHMTR